MATIHVAREVLDLIKPFLRVKTEFGYAKITHTQFVEKLIKDWHQRQLDEMGERFDEEGPSSAL